MWTSKPQVTGTVTGPEGDQATPQIHRYQDTALIAGWEKAAIGLQRHKASGFRWNSSFMASSHQQTSPSSSLVKSFLPAASTASCGSEFHTLP